jgi:hypothetical protein
MKTTKRNPWHPAGAKGFQVAKTNFDDASLNLNLAERLAKNLPADDIAVDLSTHAVILKVRACIALRGLPLPEVVFVSPESHPEALMDLTAKVQALADELANIGSFAVCSRNGESCVLVGVTDDEE